MFSHLPAVEYLLSWVFVWDICADISNPSFSAVVQSTMLAANGTTFKHKKVVTASPSLLNPVFRQHIL